VPRRIAYSLAFAVAAAGLVWAGWPGAPGDPATLINRADVIAVVVLLAGLPWVIKRRYGPAADGRLARAVRAGGYAAIFALVAVKAHVASFEYTTVGRRHLLAGVWTGEVVFVGLLAACVAGLLAVTARRPPVAPAALGTGVRAGIAAGLVLFALPPMGHPLHLANPWLAWGYDAARVLAAVLVIGVTIAAGLTAARRTSAGGRLPLADARARQGVAAGLCAGTAAALLASVLGLITISLLPQEANRLAWTHPYRDAYPVGPHWTHPYRSAYPSGVYQFEVGAGDSAAGFLSVLVLYPMFGAGLGAWGGLYAAGQPRRRPGGGGGGGGGPDGPAPPPPAPEEGARRDDERLPALLRGGYLRELPDTEALSLTPDEETAPGVVTGAHAPSAPCRALSCGDGREPGPEGG
jgi:hypothetical protein